METFSASLAICAGKSPVNSQASDAELWCFLDLRLNKRLSKQSWGWWFESLSRLLWRHRNVPDQDLYEEEQLGACVLKAGIKDSEMWLHPTYTVGYNDLSHLWYLLLAHTPQLSFQPIMQLGNPLTDIYALMYTALQNLSSLSSYAWNLSVHLYLSTRVYTSGTWNTPPDVFSLTDKTRYRNIPQNPKAKILRIQVFVSFNKIGLLMANTYIGPRKHDGVDFWKPSWWMTMIHTSFIVKTTATYDQ